MIAEVLDLIRPQSNVAHEVRSLAQDLQDRLVSNFKRLQDRASIYGGVRGSLTVTWANKHEQGAEPLYELDFVGLVRPRRGTCKLRLSGDASLRNYFSSIAFEHPYINDLMTGLKNSGAISIDRMELPITDLALFGFPSFS